VNRRQFGALALALAVPVESSQVRARPAAQPNAASVTAIERVTVLPMTDADPMAETTVVIEGDRIVAIADAAEVEVPAGAVRVDGSGKWLLPALTDMHVHFVAEPILELPYGPGDVLLPFVANGVLQIVDLASSEHTNSLRDAIAAGDRSAPRIATARMVDGDPPFRGAETATVLHTPDEARQAVTDIVAAGYDFIKVYSLLDLETFHALLAAARSQGIRVIGHLPGRREVPAAEVVVPGLALVAHAEEYAFLTPDRTDAVINNYVGLASENGVGLISTLFLDEQLLAQRRDPEMLAELEGLAHVNPVELPTWFEANRYTEAASPERIAQLESVVEFNRRLVAAFVAAGIPVLAGTDSGVSGVVAGYALHEELGALARAGLTNDQILRAATSGPAQWLGVDDDRGTVEVGKRANLLLLEGDPLGEISNTRAIAAVIHNGRVIERAALDAKLSELAATYAPVRAWFSPRAAENLRDR
jgi:imidazolonepropionase-like amidohydrolase